VLVLFRFLSLRYWLRHRGGFFLAALGVALGIAVFVSVQIANHSILAAFSATLDAVSGKANLQIIGGANGLPETVYARLKERGDTRIQAMAPVISKTLLSPSLKTKSNDSGTQVLVLGVDVFAEADFGRDFGIGSQGQNQSTGQTPRATSEAAGVFAFLIDPRAVAVSRALADKYHLQNGSALDLWVGARRERFRVRAILESEQFNQTFGGDFVLMDIAGAQEAFSLVGRLTQIDLMVDEAQLERVRADLQPSMPADARVQRPAQRGRQISGMLAAFQLTLSALSCIALFVGAFLIYNAIEIAVVRRRHDIGILRAVGAGRAQLTQLFLLEAAAIGFFGSLCGIFLGLGLSRFTLLAVSQTVSQLYLAVKANEIVVPLWLWWAAPLAGTLLAMVSAYPPAREAAGTSPRAAMSRLSLHHSAGEFARPFALAGMFFLVIAFVLCQPFLGARWAWAGFAATFFTLSGFALLTPIITRGSGHLAQRFAGTIFGIEGMLAGSYLRRALHRSSLVVAALMVSLALSIGISVMVRSFRGTVADWVDVAINADLYVSPATGFSGDSGPGLPPEAIKFITSMPQVRLFDTIRGAETVIGKQPVYIAANELPALKTGDRKIKFLSTVNGSEAAIDEFLAQRAVLISERFQHLLGYQAGQNLTLVSPNGPITLPIAGVFADYTPNECVIYLPRPIYARNWEDNGIDGLALHLQKGATVEEVQEIIERKFAGQYQITLSPNRDLRASVFNTFDQTFAVTYALQLIAILVAAIGVFDTLIALLLERAREIAVLRAMGASTRQILKMTFVEFALIAILAWAIGIAAGLCLAWQLIRVINLQIFGWTINFSLQPGVWLQGLGLALVAALCAGYFPARSAARRNLTEALQME
jgi:putative ABC transport system permease protein